MSTASISQLMTTEEFLALPDDGVERWLIEGQVREWGGGKSVTVRNWIHSAVMIALGGCLKAWRDRQTPPRGQVIGGEAGVRLSRNPDVTVGVDVGYVSAEVMARQTGKSTLIEGVPLLAVEILSPSDTQEEIDTKLTTYLSAGVALVWIINPLRRTATVYCPDALPQFVNEQDDLDGGAVLPGFRIRFGELFE
jgi:Uma2 family endonuclease